jgi:hypothetical protein
MHLSSDPLPVRYRAVAYSRRNNFAIDEPGRFAGWRRYAHGEDLAAFCAHLIYRKSGSCCIHREPAHNIFFSALHPGMVVSLARNRQFLIPLQSTGCRCFTLWI